MSRTGPGWEQPGWSRGMAASAPAPPEPWRRRTGRVRQEPRVPRPGDGDGRCAESSAAIGDLAQSRGRGRRQLVLAVGNRLPQDLRKDGRPGRHGRGERAPVLGRKGVEANAVNGLFQRQADRGGAGIKVQGLQQRAPRLPVGARSIPRPRPASSAAAPAPCGPCPRPRRRRGHSETRLDGGGSSTRRP